MVAALLEPHMKILFSRRQNFVGSKCLNFVIKFVLTSARMDFTMAMLKPYIPDILHDTILPITFLTQEDMQTFESEPIEYIQSSSDFNETVFRPRNQVSVLLRHLTGYSSSSLGTLDRNMLPKDDARRTPPDYLHGFVEFVVKNLRDYESKL